MTPIDSTRDSPLPELRQHDGVITLIDANTTIGYCRYDPARCAVEYVFVHPAHRRRGHARVMLECAAARVHGPLSFDAPLSPLGRKLVENWRARMAAERRTDCTSRPS